MKINPADSRKLQNEPKLFGRAGEAVGPHPEFDMMLKSSASENRNQICTELLKKIDEQSAELCKSPSIEGVKRYRKLVGDFLEEVMDNTYSLDNRTKWDRGGNRREFVIVKKINQSLEDLMDSMINQEKKQFDMVAKLDEIRGLLVDLYC